jgi:hypothetical protein
MTNSSLMNVFLTGTLLASSMLFAEPSLHTTDLSADMDVSVQPNRSLYLPPAERVHMW